MDPDSLIEIERRDLELRGLDFEIAIHITQLPGAGWYRRESVFDATYWVRAQPYEVFEEPGRNGMSGHTIVADRYYLPDGPADENGRVTSLFAIPYYSTKFDALQPVLEQMTIWGKKEQVLAVLGRDLWGASPASICRASLVVARERQAMRHILSVLNSLTPLLPAIKNISEGSHWQGGKGMMANAALFLDCLSHEPQFNLTDEGVDIQQALNNLLAALDPSRQTST